jgi:Putative beta barrel porin-7 (BBP7)
VAQFSSPGSPVLARPFFNFLTGQEDAGLVASPATGPGAIEVATSTSLWGAESNLALCIWHAPSFMHLTLLGGFRYLELEEQLDTSERFTAAADVPVFGGSALQVADHFGTRNQFYGGQLGAEFGVELGRFFVDLRGKIALGTNQEELQIAGATVASGGGGAGTFAGGRMALPTNTGHFDREKFTFVPEFGVNVGFQATRCLRLFAGYTFLFWNDATRPGEQIDRTVNLSQVPSAVGPGTLAGAAHPVALFRDTEFWAQGFNFGFEVRY